MLFGNSKRRKIRNKDLLDLQIRQNRLFFKGGFSIKKNVDLSTKANKRNKERVS